MPNVIGAELVTGMASRRQQKSPSPSSQLPHLGRSYSLISAGVFPGGAARPRVAATAQVNNCFFGRAPTPIVAATPSCRQGSLPNVGRSATRDSTPS